jgi:hypothetical protein
LQLDRLHVDAEYLRLCNRGDFMRIRASLCKVVVSFGAVLATATPAFAGTTPGVKIQNILIYDDGPLVYVYPVGGVKGAPGCHGSNGNYYSFSLRREFAKEYLAGLLTAQATGATVTFYGLGACREQNVSETLSYFTINSP